MTRAPEPDRSGTPCPSSPLAQCPHSLSSSQAISITDRMSPMTLCIALTHRTLPVTTWDRYHYCPHFTGEEAEARGGQSHRKKVRVSTDRVKVVGELRTDLHPYDIGKVLRPAPQRPRLQSCRRATVPMERAAGTLHGLLAASWPWPHGPLADKSPPVLSGFKD